MLTSRLELKGRIDEESPLGINCRNTWFSARETNAKQNHKAPILSAVNSLLQVVSKVQILQGRWQDEYSLKNEWQSRREAS